MCGQCCGSGMFFSQIRIFSIPDPGSKRFRIPIRIRIKEFKYFNPRNCSGFLFTCPGSGSASLYVWMRTVYAFLRVFLFFKDRCRPTLTLCQRELSVLYDPPRPNKFSKTEIPVFTIYYLRKQCILRIVRVCSLRK
jgi:hypothetical protein